MARREDRGRVLVFDADKPAALACLRSLVRHGCTVDVADRGTRPLASYSRHRAEVLVHPDPMVDPEGFVAWVLERVERRPYSLLLPVTDDSLLPLAAARERFAGKVTIALPPREGLEVFVDKGRTVELARKVGVDVPESRLCASLEDLSRAALDLQLPLVLKPGRSVASREGDVRKSLSVRYALCDEDLRRLGSELLGYGPIVAQQLVSGRGVGVEVLCDRGEIVMAFQHERLHEWPLTGGGSSLRRSVAVDPELLARARLLMDAARWHGVAMVEFKVDARLGPRLMEVNGRFWGSLPLALAAGADFPARLHDLLVEGRRPPATTARTGVLGRQFARDLWWTIEVLRRSDPSPLVHWPGRAGALLSWLQVLLPRHRFDVQDIRDPRPGLVEIVRTAREFADRIRARQRRRRIVAAGQGLRDDATRLQGRLQGRGRLLFLCHGNINRSLLAEHDLRRRLPGIAGIQVMSAGFHPRGGRAGDPETLRLAAAAGLDLGAARSAVVNAAMVESADLVLLMDADLVARFDREFPASREKAMLLGALLPAGEPIEIADPFGGSPEAYRRAFDQVRGACDALARALTRDLKSC